MIRRLLLILVCFSQLSCQSSPPTKATGKAKNVILMIGDGMGPQQISLLYYFLKYSKQGQKMGQAFAFERIANNGGSFGTSATEPDGAIVVDSACSASQLALGKKSGSEMIGVTSAGRKEKTILEKAKQRGLSVGLVSDTRLTHATPASFAAHVSNRKKEDQIAEEMLQSNADVLLSGGANRFVPSGFSGELAPGFLVTSARKDDRDLIAEAKQNNYQTVFRRSQLANLDPSKKILGLFTNHSYPNGIAMSKRKADPQNEVPSLLQLSQTAIHHLSKNNKGFFLMIEGGQIDWAGHSNDAGTMLHEMISFNETLNWVIDWVQDNPDTLLLVTADHETGSFGFGYSVRDLKDPQPFPGTEFKDEKYQVQYNYGGYGNLDRIYQQKKSLNDLSDQIFDQTKKATWQQVRQMIKDATSYSITKEEALAILDNSPNKQKLAWHSSLKADFIPKVTGKTDFYPSVWQSRAGLIARAIGGQQNVVFATSGHTATPVHFYAYGAKNQLPRFKGYLNHPELGKRLQQALGVWDD